ncbi:hypothetical protein [Amycolatopsis thailandensis]|uniref:hypothetical protein n=1 Tax=Amycolatopsis thailandensis TaxID=589330 RepID=UPI0036400E77
MRHIDWPSRKKAMDGTSRALQGRDPSGHGHVIDFLYVESGPALAAIDDSGGAVHAVADDELLATQALLARHGMAVGAAGSAALAGLMAYVRTGPARGIRSFC